MSSRRESGGGCESRAEEGEELPAAHHHRAQRWVDTEGSLDLHLGGHTDHRGVGAEKEQPRIGGPHRPGVHLGFEELPGALDQRIESGGQPHRPGRPEAGDLAEQTEEGRTPQGHPEHRSHHRIDAVPTTTGAVESVLERGGQLGGAPVDHRGEQRLLGGVPIEDRLLADTQLSGEGVEGGSVIATGAERLNGSVEDPVGGAHAPDASGFSTIW